MIPEKANEKFVSINFARYLASVHIVYGHMYQGGHLTQVSPYQFKIAQFGYTWVPWFFMLSGFILTIAETKRRKKTEKKTTIFSYIERRLKSIYPPYALGIRVLWIYYWFSFSA